MKVIFIKDLKGQGKKGEVKTVKDGYGSNFLIKNGYAVLFTESSVKRLAVDTKEENNRAKKELDLAKKVKKEIESLTLDFLVKTGKSSKVFGSISTKQIVKELKTKDIDVDKHKIETDHQLSSLGTHIVKIQLHKKVEAELKVNLKEG